MSGKREHAARPVAGGPVHVGIETPVRVTVGDVDDPAIVRARADDPGAGGNAHRRDAGRDLEHQLVRRGVVQPDRAAIGMQDLLRRVHHFGQHRHEVERRRELARDREDHLHVRHA